MKETVSGVVTATETATQTATAEVLKVIPSEGFSMDSLWRGVVGMIAILLIA